MKLPLLTSYTLAFAFIAASPLLHAETANPKKSKITAAGAAKSAADLKSEPMSDSDKALTVFAGKQSETLSSSQKSDLLNLANSGSSEDLQKINGIGDKKAQNIIAKRPYKSVDDLIMVDGIGETAYTGMVTYAKGEQKEGMAPKMAPKTKPTAVPKMKEAADETDAAAKKAAKKAAKAKAAAEKSAATAVAEVTPTPKPKKVKTPKTPAEAKVSKATDAATTAEPSPTPKVKVKKTKAPKANGEATPESTEAM